MFAIIKMRHQPNTFSFMTILEWTLNQIKCNYVQPGWYKSYCGEINSWVLTNICQRENEADLISHFEHSVLDLKTHWKFTSSLAPSGTLVFIMGYYIHTYIQTQFSKFFKFGAILPIYIHNSLSLSFSVRYIEQNQAILLHELHWQRMHVQISSRFYKVLQISLRPNMCYIF